MAAVLQVTGETLTRRSNSLHISRELRSHLLDILLHLLAFLVHSGKSLAC